MNVHVIPKRKIVKELRSRQLRSAEKPPRVSNEFLMSQAADYIEELEAALARRKTLLRVIRFKLSAWFEGEDKNLAERIDDEISS